MTTRTPADIREHLNRVEAHVHSGGFDAQQRGMFRKVAASLRRELTAAQVAFAA